MYKLEVNDDKYLDFIKNIEYYFDKSQNVLHEARNIIKVVSYKDKKFVVKKFKTPHLINKLIYSFVRDSKAKRSFEYSNKIVSFTPSPIGYIEFIKKGFFDKSFFVNEVFDYNFTMKKVLEEDFEDKKKILIQFAHFVNELHSKDILHLDFSPGNILVKKESSEFIFKIVDINRMKFKKLTKEERISNFIKLSMNEDDLKIVINEYSNLNSYEKESSIIYLNALTKKHKIKVIRKRNIKKLFKKK